jgi:gamma-tubulin complex component 5
LDKWCASKEEEICRAQAGIGSPLIVSLLSLEKAIRDTFAASFNVILDVLRTVMARVSRSSRSHSSVDVWTLPSLPTRIPPAAITALLLDTLLQAVQEHLSMVDMITSDTLMRVFAKTAEPVWSMVGRWLEHGMPIRDSSARYGEVSLDDEFFIEDNEMMLLDPDFWAIGYDLRDGAGEDNEVGAQGLQAGPKTIPVFLTHVAEDVLGSGKATGLLRALGVPTATTDMDPSHQFMKQSFNDLLALHTVHANAENGTSVSLSTDTLSRLVYDELSPHCHTTGALLTTVLVNDCDLWRHLYAVEDLYLMRRGDAMSHFTDLLFAKVRIFVHAHSRAHQESRYC